MSMTVGFLVISTYIFIQIDFIRLTDSSDYSCWSAREWHKISPNNLKKCYQIILGIFNFYWYNTSSIKYILRPNSIVIIVKQESVIKPIKSLPTLKILSP